MEVSAGRHAAGGADRQRVVAQPPMGFGGAATCRAPSCSARARCGSSRRWAGDWSRGVWMKAVASQTVFVNVATLPKRRARRRHHHEIADQPPGGYCRGRGARAGSRLERLAAVTAPGGAACHYAGRGAAHQRRPASGYYDSVGIDTFRDGPVAICAPSVAELLPRRWFPDAEGANRAPGAAQYRRLPLRVRQQDDGARGLEPDQAPHRICRHQRPRAWLRHHHVRPRRADDHVGELAAVGRSEAPGAKPYPGWPITVRQPPNGGEAR